MVPVKDYKTKNISCRSMYFVIFHVINTKNIQ